MNLIKEEKSWFEKNPKKTILFLVSFGLIFIEILIRLFFPSHLISRNNIVFNENYYKNYKNNIEFITYPSSQDSFKPVLNKINSIGIRGPELSSKSNKYRVLNIGDSFIQADEVLFHDTFGEKLNKSELNIEFISHGISSWSPTPEFSWIYHNINEINPDEVNLFLCINDFFRKDVYNGDQYYRSFVKKYINNIPVSYNIPDKTLKGYLSKLYSYKLTAFTASRLKILFSKKKYSVKNELIMLSKNKNEWDSDLKINVINTLNVIFNLKTFLDSKKVKLNVLFVPLGFAWSDEVKYGKQSYDYKWEKNFKISQSGIENYAKKFLELNQISHIELSKYFDQYKKKSNQLLYNEMDGHWNKNGHFTVYKILEEYYKK